MAVKQVKLDEGPVAMRVASSSNESKQGEMDKLGKKRNCQQKFIKKISKEITQRHTVLFAMLQIF